jgi:hypothetical protein
MYLVVLQYWTPVELVLPDASVTQLLTQIIVKKDASTNSPNDIGIIIRTVVLCLKCWYIT